MFAAHLSPRDIGTPSCGLSNLDETVLASLRGGIRFQSGSWVFACKILSMKVGYILLEFSLIRQIVGGEWQRTFFDVGSLDNGEFLGLKLI